VLLLLGKCDTFHVAGIPCLNVESEEQAFQSRRSGSGCQPRLSVRAILLEVRNYGCMKLEDRLRLKIEKFLLNWSVF
jgi:hypothetical protein